jgi:hypothetical protein
MNQHLFTDSHRQVFAHFLCQLLQIFSLLRRQRVAGHTAQDTSYYTAS